MSQTDKDKEQSLNPPKPTPSPDLSAPSPAPAEKPAAKKEDDKSYFSKFSDGVSDVLKPNTDKETDDPLYDAFRRLFEQQIEDADKMSALLKKGYEKLKGKFGKDEEEVDLPGSKNEKTEAPRDKNEPVSMDDLSVGSTPNQSSPPRMSPPSGETPTSPSALSSQSAVPLGPEQTKTPDSKGQPNDLAKVAEVAKLFGGGV
jgi:hypothetical protein